MTGLTRRAGGPWSGRQGERKRRLFAWLKSRVGFAAGVSVIEGTLDDDAYRLATLRRIEDEILRQTSNEVEFFLLLGARGDPLYAKLGQRNVIGGQVLHAVALRRSELRPFVGRGYLLTHNHPNGLSFTPEDVITMAVLNVREGNAFDAKLRYRLIRLKDRWPQEDELTREAAELEAEVIAFQADALRQRQMTPEQAAVAHYHLVWTLFAQRHANAFAYRREAR